MPVKAKLHLENIYSPFLATHLPRASSGAHAYMTTPGTAVQVRAPEGSDILAPYDPIYNIGDVPMASLLEIDEKMNRAHQERDAGHFMNAIARYEEARTLIERLLSPNLGVEVHAVDPGERKRLPHEFIEPLTTVIIDYLNLLPPKVPGWGPGGGDDILPNSVPGKEYARLGLQTQKLTMADGTSAYMHWQTSQIYAAQGNTAQAKAHRNVAMEANQSIFQTLNSSQHATATPGWTAPAIMRGAGLDDNGGLPEEAGEEEAIDRAANTGPSAASSRRVFPASLAQKRVMGLLQGDKVVTIAWEASKSPPQKLLVKAVYEYQKTTEDLHDLARPPADPPEFALWIPRIYYYLIPFCEADCYYGLHVWPKAEELYLYAAEYRYLNEEIEGRAIWLRLACMYVDQGNEIFRQGADKGQQAIEAAYNMLIDQTSVDPVGGILEPPHPAQSFMYETGAAKPLRLAAQDALAIFANWSEVIVNPNKMAELGVNPAIPKVLLEAYRRMLNAMNGCDFDGHYAFVVPIWTFDYLQQVAINFCQLAIGAERDWLNWKAHADDMTVAREQLAQAVARAQGAVTAATNQKAIADKEATVYADGVTVANARKSAALTDYYEYKHESAQWNMDQALAAQLSGGENADPDRLNKQAEWLRGNVTVINPYTGEPITKVSGPAATMGAARTLAGLREQSEYQAGVMQRQAGVLAKAAQQALDQQAVATSRAEAAEAAVIEANAEVLRQQAVLDAFDSLDAINITDWQWLSEGMKALYLRYLEMAIRTAKLMQMAYNFENDENLDLIRSNYSTHGSTNDPNGLLVNALAADYLMADIQTFTHDLVTAEKPKPQPIRQTLALAGRYSLQFERDFRATGKMLFQTSLEDFEDHYPGAYAGRIENVEVEIVGLLPMNGISGTLTNTGVSAYRDHDYAYHQGAPAATGLRFRVQPKETLILSDYTIRQDAGLVPGDPRMRRIFQGAGLASTWELDLPKGVNDLDYGAITDIRLTFYYKARFDPGLREQVKLLQASHAGINKKQLSLPLRWIYPDAFFHFQDTGELTITLKLGDFPCNQRNQTLTDVAIILTTDGTVSPDGLKVRLATPGKNPQLGTATVRDGQKYPTVGAIYSSDAGSAWASLIGGSALGDFTLGMQAAENPVLVKNGALDLTPIHNIALLLGYSFTPKS